MESENVTRDQFCRECSAWSLPVAHPAIVQLTEDSQNWRCREKGTPVHIAALFRDPGIAAKRPVKVVLDLHCRDGHLYAGENCWVRAFLEALRGLPAGITVALDNGVRCPTPTKEGYAVFWERARHCHERTVQWFSELQHPCGGSPNIVLCDKDLAYSLAELGQLRYRNGEIWRKPTRFVDAVGDEVSYLGVKAVILAHPSQFYLRHARRYRRAFADRKIVSVLTQLARLGSGIDPAQAQ